jgi:hypothetical protein
MEKEKPEITAANMRKVYEENQEVLDSQDLRTILSKIEEVAKNPGFGTSIDFPFSGAVRKELERRGFKIEGSEPVYISW